MKKFLAILVSAILVMALALPVMASSPFSDVGENHWALEAVRLLAALGILEGYPDGTFKGRNNATRYEMAVVVARALEYLDKDIRDLAERVGELDAKVQAQPSPTSQPADKDGVILQPPASPDATILEQVIAEKIAGMSEAQWEEFDERLSALLARIDDLREDNKTEHTQLWAAIEALRTGQPVIVPANVDVQGAVDAIPGSDKIVAEAVAQSEAAWAKAVERLDKRIDGIAADTDNLDARLEALRRAIFEEGRAAEGENGAIGAQLSATLDNLASNAQPDADEACKVLLAAHAAQEQAARDNAIAELESRLELALLEQKAELMMAFYDSIIASNDDRDRLIASLKEDFNKALAARDAAVEKAIQDNAADLQLVIDQQNAALSMAFRDSLNAYADEVGVKFDDMADKFELMLLEQKAELTMATYNSIEAMKDEYDARLDDMEATWELLLLQQKAELMMAFYDSLQAEADERVRALEALAEKHDLDLLQLRAELQMGFYDSIIAQREEFEGRIDVVVATIDALKTEYDRELKALSARVGNLESQLAKVQAQADQNTRDIAENYHKIKTEEIAPLNQRVGKLEEEVAAVKTEVNRVRITGSDEVKFVDITAHGDVGAVFYKDPFNRTGSSVYAPTAKFQNDLTLKLNIQPDPGVSVVGSIGVLTDVFGVKDTATNLPKLDIDMTVTNPSGSTKIVAGELARPVHFTKYQASAKVWGDNALEGLSLAYDGGVFKTGGFAAKIGDSGDATSTSFRYVTGAGARYYLLENLSFGARGMKIVDSPWSGDTISNPEETVGGADFALTLANNWKIGGEFSMFKAEVADPYKYAFDVNAGGKLGIFNLNLAHEAVDAGYAPKYLATSASDGDYVKADSKTDSISVKTDSIKGWVVSGAIERAGKVTTAADDTTTYSAGAEYNTKLIGADLTLRGDVEQVHDAAVETVTKLGFDAKYNPLKAGFTWKNDVVDAGVPAVSYIGYVNLNLPLATDTLTVRGNWEQSFGAEQWHTWGAGIKMAMPLVENVLTLGANAGYDVNHNVPGLAAKDNNQAKMVLASDLTWKMSDATSLTGIASYEARERETATEALPSGTFLQLGAALNHKFYKNTSLSLKCDVKNVLYSTAGVPNYKIRAIDLSLKTTF